MDTSIKILATADLHLGRSSADLSDSHASTKYTLTKLVEYCIDKQVDILLLCGDIVDWDNRFFEAYGPLQSAFDQLGKAKIKVFLVAGNHDFNVLPQIIETGNNQHVHLLGKDQQWEVQEYSKNGHTIQFVGWSFSSRFVKESALYSWAEVNLNPNYQTIGLLHGDTDAANSIYGPIRLDDLRNTGVALWLLGHIHKPQQLAEQPHVWYTGSPQALSAKEPGLHGPLLITVKPDLPIHIEAIQMSPIRYESISIDITSVSNENELRDQVIRSLHEDAEAKITELEEVKSLIYEVTLVGKNSKGQEIDSWKRTITDHQDRLDATGTEIRVRKVSSQIQPEVLDLKQLAQQSSPAGMLANTIIAIEENREDSFLEELIKEWKVKVEKTNGVGAYSPLSADRKLEITTENAKEAIKVECNRLLGELMNQLSPN